MIESYKDTIGWLLEDYEEFKSLDGYTIGQACARSVVENNYSDRDCLDNDVITVVMMTIRIDEKILRANHCRDIEEALGRINDYNLENELEEDDLADFLKRVADLKEKYESYDSKLLE